MLTRAGSLVLFSGLALLTSGLALGNLYYSALALVPLCAFLAAIAVESPTGIRATMSVSKPHPRASEEVVVEVAYEIKRGAGSVEIHVPLPETFEMRKGRNVHLVAKPLGQPVRGMFAFTIHPGKRGKVDLGPVKVECVHALGVRGPVTVDAGPALAMEVRPDAAPVRRIRGLAGFAKQLFPENDRAVSGIQTTDFRDIREYQSSDPLRSINWKATARQPSSQFGEILPLVNEYEREGKKSVWLFLDAAPYMQVGTTLDNSFEHAIKGATGMLQFYADRGYRIGAYVYNSDKQGFLYPDVGRRQILRWQRIVTGLQPGEADHEGPYAAVERAHRFLLQERPLVIVVTRLGKADERFYMALRKLRSITGRRRRNIPVLVVSPVVHATIPKAAEYSADIVELLRRRERPILQRVRRTGARVVEWDPTKTPLESALMPKRGK